MSPDVGEEGWVPLDDPLARIPVLIAVLRKHPNELAMDTLREIADVLESAQARIAELTAELDELLPARQSVDELQDELVMLSERLTEAEQRAARYRSALERIVADVVHDERLDPVARQALALDSARPATEPDDLTPAELSAAARRLLRKAAEREGAADEPQEDDRG